MKLYIESSDILNLSGVERIATLNGVYHLGSINKSDFIIPCDDHAICLELLPMHDHIEFIKTDKEKLAKVANAKPLRYSSITFKPFIFIANTDIVGHIDCETVEKTNNVYFYSSSIITAVIEMRDHNCVICVVPSCKVKPAYFTLQDRKRSLRRYIIDYCSDVEFHDFGHMPSCRKECQNCTTIADAAYSELAN